MQRRQDTWPADSIRQVSHQLIQAERFTPNGQPGQQRLFQSRSPADLLFEQLAYPLEEESSFVQKGRNITVKQSPYRIGHQLEGQRIAAITPSQGRHLSRCPDQRLVYEQRPAGGFR